jgi:hypothetical protein
VQLSRRSQQKFADMAASLGTVRTIEDIYEAHGFVLPAGFQATEGRARRSVCEAAEAGIDLSDPTVFGRLLGVYLDAVDDWGRRGRDDWFGPASDPNDDPLLEDARALVPPLQRDGAPVDHDGNLVLGAAAPTFAVEVRPAERAVGVVGVPQTHRRGHSRGPSGGYRLGQRTRRQRLQVRARRLRRRVP